MKTFAKTKHIKKTISMEVKKLFKKSTTTTKKVLQKKPKM